MAAPGLSKNARLGKANSGLSFRGLWSVAEEMLREAAREGIDSCTCRDYEVAIKLQRGIGQQGQSVLDKVCATFKSADRLVSALSNGLWLKGHVVQMSRVAADLSSIPFTRCMIQHATISCNTSWVAAPGLSRNVTVWRSLLG